MTLRSHSEHFELLVLLDLSDPLERREGPPGPASNEELERSIGRPLGRPAEIGSERIGEHRAQRAILLLGETLGAVERRGIEVDRRPHVIMMQGGSSRCKN
jgi:hypothetical protein